MSLWTRTVLLLVTVMLAVMLVFGVQEAISNEPSDIDRFVAARNFRRALAYRTVDYQGGKVARADNGEKWRDADSAEDEKHPGAVIEHARSLAAVEAHEANIADAYLQAEIKKVSEGTGDTGEARGIERLRNDIAKYNRERRQTTNRLTEIEGSVRAFAMELDGYSYLIQNFQQLIFNLDYEIHLAIIQRNALLAELAQVQSEAGRLADDKRSIEQQNYELSSGYAKAARTIAEYEQRDPTIRGYAARVGSPWLRGVVTKASEDSRVGLVWLSIGAQDGLQSGQVLSIHRGQEFIGRMRVESLERNEAVGRLLEEFRGTARPRANDRVRGAPNFGGGNATMRVD